MDIDPLAEGIPDLWTDQSDTEGEDTSTQPPPIMPENNDRAADTARREKEFRAKEMSQFAKDLRTWDVSSARTWTVFQNKFQSFRLIHDTLKEDDVKMVLYNSLVGHAEALACPALDPIKEPYKSMSIDDYLAQLTELFEPKEESECIKTEFIQRQQRPLEHPNLYFNDKLNLFHRAFKAELRDYDHFYDLFIDGLINQRMKDYLRVHLPETKSNTAEFRKSLLFIANVVRKCYIKNEITETEALGAEAFNSSSSYLAAKAVDVNLGLPNQIKSEPVNSVNAISRFQRPERLCYHCKQTGHFIAKCPRKAAGLAQVVNMVKDKNGKVTQLGQWRAGSSSGTNTSFQKGGTKFKGTKPFAKGKFTRRIAHILEDEEGNAYLVEDDSEADDEATEDTEGENAEHSENLGTTETEEVEEGVNTILLDPADCGDVDLAGAFLGY